MKLLYKKKRIDVLKIKKTKLNQSYPLWIVEEENKNCRH
jgi:hypothetical protein